MRVKPLQDHYCYLSWMVPLMRMHATPSVVLSPVRHSLFGLRRNVSASTLAHPRKSRAFLTTSSSTPPDCLARVPQGPTNVNKIRPSPTTQAQARSHQLSTHLSPVLSSSLQSRSSSTMAQQTLPTRGGFEAKAPSVYTPRKVGAAHTLEYRVFIEKDGVPVSPFHDIPLYANEQQTILNMVVEIPRWTNAKQEVGIYRPGRH